MKRTLLISSLLGLSLLAACSKEEDAKMVFTYTNQTPNLINEKGDSCVGRHKNPIIIDDLPAAYFSLSAPVLNWKSTTSTAEVTSIRFKINGGPFKDKIVSIDGTELDVLFALDRKFASATQSGETVSPTTKELLCGIVVSGLTMTEAQDVTFQAAVTGSIDGVEIDNSSKEENTFQTLFYFTVNNRGKNL